VATRTVRAVTYLLDNFVGLIGEKAQGDGRGVVPTSWLEVGDIFRAAGDSYRATQAGHLSLNVRSARSKMQ
jgi:hypothetical protein